MCTTHTEWQKLFFLHSCILCNLLLLFFQTGNPQVNHSLAVKEYSRSSADQVSNRYTCKVDLLCTTSQAKSQFVNFMWTLFHLLLMWIFSHEFHLKFISSENHTLILPVYILGVHSKMDDTGVRLNRFDSLFFLHRRSPCHTSWELCPPSPWPWPTYWAR